MAANEESIEANVQELEALQEMAQAIRDDNVSQLSSLVASFRDKGFSLDRPLGEDGALLRIAYLDKRWDCALVLLRNGADVNCGKPSIKAVKSSEELISPAERDIALPEAMIDAGVIGACVRYGLFAAFEKDGIFAELMENGTFAKYMTESEAKILRSRYNLGLCEEIDISNKKFNR